MEKVKTCETIDDQVPLLKNAIRFFSPTNRVSEKLWDFIFVFQSILIYADAFRMRFGQNFLFNFNSIFKKNEFDNRRTCLST